MLIKRVKLTNEFEKFALNGNGIVVGAPGVGKTFLLKHLCSNIITKNIKCLYLPVDRLSFENETELMKELNIKTNFIDYLKKQKSTNNTGLIIFDGFDAARSENIRSFYLNLIEKLIYKLDDSWNIIVSIRIYDARKSRDLLDIFPKNNSLVSNFFQIDDINCRHFAVTELDEGEMEHFLNDKPQILDLYKQGTSDLKKILHIPFNIWLLEKLIESKVDLSQLSYMTSEVQLLGLFWEYRVTDGILGNANEILLSEITRKMVGKSSLSLRKDEIYHNEYEASWNSLMSSEILINITSTGQRVSFSHNILFDYAVSVLLIEDDSRNMLKFIKKDLTRPLFLRPSLNYYFIRLWYTERNTFWDNFWSLFASDDINLHLLSRLLPIITIIDESKDIEDLEPIFSPPIHLADSKNLVISRMIQALIALKPENDELWVEFLKKSANKMNITFARDLAVMTRNILDEALKVNDIDIIQDCGVIGRLLLGWAWDNRINEDSRIMEFLGRLSIPLIAKSYKTNVEESRKLLCEVLKILNEDNFSIDLIFLLTSELDHIWQIDPEFAAEVYRSVFSYQEESESSVSMGTPILPLSSTRRQDFEMCYYELIEKFPKFIKDEPLIATQAGIESLNSYVIEKEIKRFYEVKIEEFKFRGKNSKYIPDGSYIWDRNVRNEPIKIGNEIFKFISKLNVDDPLFKSLMDIFAEKACVAFFWKRLLEIGSENPGKFASELLELCLAIPVQIEFETVYALTNFIDVSSESYDEENLLKIENSILNIPNIESKLEKEYLKKRRDRYLSRIPFDLLKNEESKTIINEIKAEGKIPDNRPIVEFGEVTSEKYTEEKWFKDSGINIKKPENKRLYNLSSKINEFNSEFREIPNKSKASSILPIAKELYFVLLKNKNADEDVYNSAWTHLATYCEIISRSNYTPKNDEFKFSREVLLLCATLNSPKVNEYNIKFDHPSWTPAPRNEAAIGLPFLSSKINDAKIINTLKNLSKDKVPSVRYLVSRNLIQIYSDKNAFWSLANEIVTSEKNLVVLHGLLNSLSYIIADNEFRTVAILKKLIEKVPLDEDSNFLESLTQIIMWLSLSRDNEWAIKVSHEVLEDPVNKSNFLKYEVFYALKYINPEKSSSQRNNEAKKALDWLNLAVNVVGRKIDEFPPEIEDKNELQQKLGEMHQIINEIITRIYFAADIRNDDKKISDIERRKFYINVKPLLEKIISIQSQNGIMLSRTAYYFLELLNGVLKYDPEGSLHMASEIAKISEPDGFNRDHIALKEVVKFVEVLLADHRRTIQNEGSLRDLVNLLDIFADVGWSEAIILFWRLDEIFR